MVVLDHDHIVESETMIHSSTQSDGLLFKEAHTGCGFPGVKDLCSGPFQQTNIGIGGRGNAAHSLHHIQNQSFAL